MLSLQLRDIDTGVAIDVGESCPPTLNLDANANAPVTERVTEAVVRALRAGTNPSSDHAGGAAARILMERARDAVVSLAVGVFDDGVIFTSGCTEANNTVLNTVRTSGATLITSAVEHPSILTPAGAIADAGFNVLYLPVSSKGQIDVDGLGQLLSTIDGPVLLSIQTANSETGVIQPIADIAAVAARYGNVLFHSDAAQSFGKLPTLISRTGGPQIVSISGHKLHGPMGVGALLLADGEERLTPMMRGGDQERGRRAGTEPVALIAGMGAACEARAAAFSQEVATMRELRDRLEDGIRDAVPLATINGSNSPRLPNTSSIRFAGIEAMALLAHLDAGGVLASQGSACSSMRPAPSHVLIAMGLSEDEAFSTIRFSTSPLNTPAEIDRAIAVTAAACNELGSSR